MGNRERHSEIKLPTTESSSLGRRFTKTLQSEGARVILKEATTQTTTAPRETLATLLYRLIHVLEFLGRSSLRWHVWRRSLLSGGGTAPGSVQAEQRHAKGASIVVGEHQERYAAMDKDTTQG